MAVLKCKMCGAALTVGDNDKFAQCLYCGSMQTLPNMDDERKTKLFNRATELRLACEFDQAAGVFQSIVAEFPEEAEAYWGLVLCKYGIEYVDSPSNGKRVPTCHRTCPTSVLADSNYLKACEYVEWTKWKYEEEAKAIDELQQKILKVSLAEEPYDVFLCYKENDPETHTRTEDSFIVQDLYTNLIAKGYKVFYARITLQGKAGTEYEPYIYAALSSAKVMLVIGSKQEYLEAVWVKNEWARYLEMMKDGGKVLIPCYKKIKPSKLPLQLRGLQALNMDSLTFLSDLHENIERVAGKTSAAPVAQVVEQPASQTATDTTPLLRRAELFLEDGEWQSADEYCEKALDLDPECAKAYVFKMLAKYRKNNIGQLDFDFEAEMLFKKAIRFADASLKAELETALANGKEVQEKARLEAERKAREEAERKARLEAERKAREEAERKARLEAERKAREEAERKARLEAERKAREEAERKARLEAERKAREEAERKAREEIERQRRFEMLRERSKMCSRLIAAHGSHTVGLNSNGTVVAVGHNKRRQCNVSSWKDIVAIAAGYECTVGLKADGTVIATGDNRLGQCNVSSWKGIVAIAAGTGCTVGLKADGTVVAVGFEYDDRCNVSDWRDIAAIAVGGLDYMVGLKADGTVIATGDNRLGQCNVSSWKDIVAIAAGGAHTVGLKADGTVVAVGDNKKGECNVSSWKDIVAIAAGCWFTIGLKADGTVVAVGDNEKGACNVSSWKDIVAIAENYFHTIGLKADGTLVTTEEIRPGQNRAYRFRLFDNLAVLQDSLKQTQREGKVQIQREAKGLCRHCGGTFKGLFTKSCSSCGKPKDY